MRTITDPRVADAQSRLILAENDLDAEYDRIESFTETLPARSRDAFYDYALTGEFHDTLPECERVDFTHRARKLRGIHRSIERNKKIANPLDKR